MESALRSRTISLSSRSLTFGYSVTQLFGVVCIVSANRNDLGRGSVVYNLASS